MKRWKITVELNLESPDVVMGGIPVSEGFIRERTANAIAAMIRENDRSGYWRYTTANIVAVSDESPREPLFP